MIRLEPHLAESVDAHLAEAVVDARIEIVVRLGNDVLGRLVPSAGTVGFDATQRRGALDVDAAVGEALMHDRHPAGNIGQALEVQWTWPIIGVSVPLGWWLTSEAEHLGSGLWRIAADPEGPARLDRAKWWQPGGVIVSGVAGAQSARMTRGAGVEWVPSLDFSEWKVPPTECEAGETVLSTLEKVIEQAGAELRPRRLARGVEIGHRASGDTTHWAWGEGGTPLVSVSGKPSTDEIPNRVTVWREEDKDGKRTVTGWSEMLKSGPRRWGGPYGRVPEVIKLDGPATVDAMRDQAKRHLNRRVEEASTVQVALRADPRIEVGDIATIKAPHADTDCVGRVASVKLDAGSGLAEVECTVLRGLVCGQPAQITTT